MDINNIFAYGSTVDVLVRVHSARTISTQSYAAGEPYTIIRNVPVEFSYDGEEELINPRGLLTVYKTDYPVAVTLKGVTLTDKIAALIFKPVTSTLPVSKMLGNAQIAAQFYIDAAATDIYLYKDAVKTTDFTFVEGLITISGYSSAAEYMMIYNLVSSKDKISFSLPHNAYFTLEMFGKGAKNGVTTSIFLHLNKCALMTDKQLNFNSGSGNSIDLLFGVIKDDNDFIIFGE